MSPIREPADRSPHPCRVRLWLDAQFAPSLARWMSTDLGIDATAPLEGRERFRRIEVPRAAAEAMEKLLAKHLKG